MRDTPRPPINQAIVALDQRDLVRTLCVLEIPAVIGVGFDAVSLAVAVWVNKGDRDKVRIGDRVRVRNGQRVFVDGLDGPPYINDLESLLAELVGFLWEMVVYTALRGAI
jgi:hypothetical protein